MQENTLKSIKAKTLGYEDLPALVYLHLKLEGYLGYDKYIHVVVDEAQDYGLFHFDVLKKLFKNSTFSIFGDLAQSIYSYQSIHDWEGVMHEVFFDNVSLLKLEKSYRTTYEIMEASNLVSKWFVFGDAKAVLRHGEKVLVQQVDNQIIAGFLKEKIDAFLKKGFKSIAIISKDEKSLKDLSNLLNDDLIYNCMINSKNTEYNGGICLVSSYLAKGLEFDAVIIYDIEAFDANKEIDMKLLYVAMTRALHELVITYRQKLIYPLLSLKDN